MLETDFFFNESFFAIICAEFTVTSVCNVVDESFFFAHDNSVFEYKILKKKVTRRRSRRVFIYGHSPTILAACKGTHVDLPPARVLTKPPVNGHYLPNKDICSPNLSSSNCC